MDINYNFEVMLPELAEIHALTNSPVVLGMARRFTDWFGYNLLREPDGSGWLTYYAVSARTTTADYDDVIPDPDRTSLASLFVPAIPKLGAFFTAREDRAATRGAWAADPAPVPVLTKLDTSPRIIAHAGYGEALPSTSEKQVAIRQVPYLRSRDFAEIRRDALTNQDFVYVRHPRYYAGAFFGWRATQDHVHAGPGFLWHPDAGTIIHAQQTATGCWSTVLATGHPDAENDLVAAYLVGGNAWGGEQVRPAGAAVQVRYRMPDSRVVTEFTLAPDSLTRSVRATTAATEQIPLVLLPTDVVSFANGTAAPYNQTTAAVADGLIVRRGSTTIAINWGTPRPATLSTSSRTYLKDARRRIHVLRIPHSGALDTRITL
jgi:hypothetical protein